jgi:ABC-type transport system involved in cytochrome bd biosynthesis fused ATPase/permease subunit
MVLIGSMAQRLAQQQLQQLQRLGAVFVDAIVGVTTLKLFARTRAYTEIIAHTAEAFRDSTMKTLRIAFTSALVLELIATLSTAIVAVEVGLRLLYGRLVFEQAFLILLLAPEFYLPLRLLGTRFHAGMAGVEATRRIFALLNKADTLVKRGHVAAPLPTHIVFKQVRFTYANSSVVTSHRPTPAVDSIDLELKPNKLLALVGPSGAGKSSIVRLLLRFIDPEQGDIFVNDINLVDIDVQSWRQRIAWVAERPYLFASSVADNIRLGQHQASEADVVNAARTAHAEDFICQLPNGFNSSVGEHGVNLAGGEAQRIAIARAVLKNAPLVVLDEYSAHLDAIANAKLQLASRELIQNRCVLVVAHRLATVQAADEIVVLDAGRIVDRGTHEQLLRHCPLYQSLVTSFEATP